MITLLFIISITILIISIIFNKKGNEARKDTTGWFTSIILFGFTTVICLFLTLGFAASVVSSKYIAEKITMYIEQNNKIEEQIDIVVKQYQEYESDTYAMTSSESSITLVSLYPDLKSDELVKEQIKVYTDNNKKITELKEKQINAKACKWWIYFGG